LRAEPGANPGERPHERPPYAGRSASGAESARWAHAVRPGRPEAALDLCGEGWEGATVCLASPASRDSVGHGWPRPNLQKRALIRGALAQVRVAVGAEDVDRVAHRLTARPLAGDEYGAERDLVAHAEQDGKRPAVVVEFDRLAVREPPAFCFGRMQQ